MGRISQGRLTLLILTTVLTIVSIVFVAASFARASADHSARQQTASQLMLTAMINQETGARGYFETNDRVFLSPYVAGSAAFSQALSESRSLAGADPTLSAELNEQSRISTTWRTDTQAEIERLESGHKAPSVAQALAGKATMDDFRVANAAYDALLNSERSGALTSQTWWAVGLAGVMSVILLLGGWLVVRAAARRERRHLGRQRELREMLQASESEPESQTLLIRHIQRTVPGSAVAVLNRNNSDDRLEPTIEGDSEATALRGIKLDQLTPRACMAVRLSRPHVRLEGEETLMQCEVCGKIEGNIECEPLLVGGRVIGSVLVARQDAITERERDVLRTSVVQAAPILANQRNLAIAETRAASDALTGLSNRRSADETLKRLVAHAGRRASPLSAILLDLDHFKQINDVHGHDQGDKALALVGEILRSTLRASDFAARYGGEEFLILLPDTDRDAARQVAEKMRVLIETAEVPQIGPLTASFGVAELPADAAESEQLMRKADRALYAAKAGGRNRVEVALSSVAENLSDVTTTNGRADLEASTVPQLAE
jgi:diguanylate cyclase (GGDEF)-like protein